MMQSGSRFERHVCCEADQHKPHYLTRLRKRFFVTPPILILPYIVYYCQSCDQFVNISFVSEFQYKAVNMRRTNSRRTSSIIELDLPLFLIAITLNMRREFFLLKSSIIR